MNELIQTFIEDSFIDIYREEVYKSFSIFEAFQHHTAYQGFVDLIMNEGIIDKTSITDMFNQELHEQLNFVLTQHSIVLYPTVTIPEKNQILDALFRLQSLEDYTGIIRSLETFDSDEVQLSWILSDICMLDQTHIMTLIESFNPRILKTLKKFIYQKEMTQDVKDLPNGNLLKNMRRFTRVFGSDNLGSQLVRSNMLIGERFETYIEYVRDSIVVDTVEKTALNMLSVLYISSDGFNSPILIYRKNSYRLLQDLDLVTKVEGQMLNYIGQLDEYKKADEEKERLADRHVEINQSKE